jgi:toxin ParE1/3/4
MKIVWSRRAVRHLTSVRDYIAKDDPKAAEETARRILESADRLAAHPHLGRTSYIVPYRIKGERLELIAVFQGRQKWPTKLTYPSGRCPRSLMCYPLPLKGDASHGTKTGDRFPAGVAEPL